MANVSVYNTEERAAGEAGELGNDGHGICCGCQQTCGIAQTVLIEEAVHTFTIGTGTDGIGHVMFIGAEELGEAVAIHIGVGIDMVWTIHEVADTAEELLIGC